MRRLIISILVAVIGLSLIGALSRVNALNSVQSVCTGVGAVSGGSDCSTPSGSPSIDTPTIQNILNILTVIIGIVAVIMMIVGGFKYITSGGDANNVSSAKNTILYAVVGLIVVALAQVIVRFVVSKVSKST